MAGIELGAQLRIHDLKSEPALNGKACVCLNNGGSGRATVRLGTGRELLAPLENLTVMAPSGKLPTGTRVMVVGLKAAPELNGRFGVVAPTYSPPAGRLLIEVGEGNTKALKYDNFVIVDLDALAKNSNACGAFPTKTKVKIRNFIDEGMNGTEGVVLEKDVHDPNRLMVMIPSKNKVMTFRPDNLGAAGGNASNTEMNVFLPTLREVFHTEVRKLLWGIVYEKLPLMSLSFANKDKTHDNPLSNSAKIQSSWAALQAAFGEEGMPMFSVLREREDLFTFWFDHGGVEFIGLSDNGRHLNIKEGIAEPPAKKRKMDMDSGKFGKDEMARAFFSALLLCGAKGQAVSISKLGSDVTVAQLRKDPEYRKYKLLDVVKEYPNVFKVSADACGNTNIELTDHAEVALPQRTAGESAPKGGGDVLPKAEQSQLPDKIEEPATASDKLQALRIEIVHALFKRDGKAEPQMLGQEPGVSKMRKNMPKKMTLLDLVRLFPANFTVAVDTIENKVFVYLDSMDVSDMSFVDDHLKSRGHGFK